MRPGNTLIYFRFQNTRQETCNPIVSCMGDFEGLSANTYPVINRKNSAYRLKASAMLRLHLRTYLFVRATRQGAFPFLNQRCPLGLF